MANPTPSRGPTNFFDYKADQDVISPSAWKNNASLTFFKLLNNLQQVATLYPLLDPETSAKYIADWPFVETFEARSPMDTYPGGQGAVNVAVRKNINKLLYTYMIKLLTPYCPKIDKSLNVLEYNDDASPLHVRDAHGDIVERMPLVPLLIAKLKQKTYKGTGPQQESGEPHPGFQRPQRFIGLGADYYHRLARQHRHALVNVQNISRVPRNQRPALVRAPRVDKELEHNRPQQISSRHFH
jgi:hypothetical protein